MATLCCRGEHSLIFLEGWKVWRRTSVSQRRSWVVRTRIATIIMTVDVIAIFHLSQTSTTVVLRAATTLLVAEVLSGAWSEEPLEQRNVSLKPHRATPAQAYRHVPHSQRYVASWTDCQGQERHPRYQRVDPSYGRSAGFSTCLADVDSISTFGRKDGCSSMTELLRNFWTRQSRP